MNCANGGHTRDLESKLAYHPPISSTDEKESSKEAAARESAKMSKLQHCIFTILLVCLLALGIGAAALNKYSQDAAHPMSAEETRFQQLLNSVDPSALHDVLHVSMKEKYRHGVFQEDRIALEAIYQQNAEVAETLIELAKRQASGNSTVVTTTAVTTTSTVVTSTDSITSTPSSTPSTTPPQSTTSTPSQQSTSAPVSSTASSTTTGSASTSSGTTSASSSTSSSSTSISQSTFPKRRQLLYPFTPASPMSNCDKFPTNSTTTLASPSVFPTLSSPMNMTQTSTCLFPYMAAPSSVQVNTPSSSPAASRYALAPRRSILLNTTTANVSAPATLPMLCLRDGSAVCATAPTASVPANITSIIAMTFYTASLTSSVPPNTTCLSTSSTPYVAAPPRSVPANTSAILPTLCLRNGSGACAAAHTISVLANTTSSSPASSPYAAALASSILSKSSSPYSSASFSDPISAVSNTTTPVPSAYVFNNSTSGSSPANSSSPFSSTLSTATTIRSSSNSPIASTSQSSSSQDETKTSSSSTRTSIYATTLPNGAVSTVTSVTIVLAGQADQTSGGPASPTKSSGKASLQTGAVGRLEVGLSAVVGGAAMVVMGAL